MRENNFGKGTYYNLLKNYFEIDDCIAVMIIDDLKNLKTFEMTKVFNYQNIVAIVSLPVNQIMTLIKEANMKECNLLIGNVLTINDNSLYIVYSGDEKVYKKINMTAETSKQQYLGKNPMLSSVIGNSVNGIHYSYELAYYVGIALSIKYDLPLETYFTQVGKAVPMLCEGAYRNIWYALADDNNYEDVDDVIHGMEMLVCKMKKNHTKDLIFDNSQKQRQLNKILNNYWTYISFLEGKNG